MAMSTMVNLVTLLVLICYVPVPVHSSLYSEVQHLNGSCFPRDSCFPQRNPMNDHLWGQYTCVCGQHCIRFGTCCANSPFRGKIPPVPPPEMEKCQKLELFQFPIMMISQCAKERHWDSSVRDKCEKGPNPAEVPVTSMVPVTSLTTQTTYKNYFCAQCNYGGDSFVYWNVRLTMESEESYRNLSKYHESHLLDSLTYDEDQKSWGVFSNQDHAFYQVNIQYVLPPYLKKLVKKCHANMVDNCSSSFKDTEFEKKCYSYYSPVEYQQNGAHSVVYRNVHCALCSNVSTVVSERKSCHLELTKRKLYRLLSFAYLLDINRNEGNVVGMKRIPSTECGASKKWDPIAKKCRAIVCGLPGFKLINGKCQRKFNNVVYET